MHNNGEKYGHSYDEADRTAQQTVTVTGRIRDLQISKNVNNQNYLSITLMEYDDVRLALNPVLFIQHKDSILEEQLLEYSGIPTVNYDQHLSDKQMIAVASISAPKTTETSEKLDYE